MFSLWLIIGIAAASAISLTVSGVLTAVYIERRRNRKWMKENNIDRSLSERHRPHLSITDLDFSSLPRPVHSLQESPQRPRVESSRFYSSGSSQEDVKAYFEDELSDPTVNPGHVGIGDSFQWLSPSKGSRRKKKIPRLIVSGPPTRNRLSAVTELSEEARQRTPEPVELPAHRTPRVTPEKEVDFYPKEQTSNTRRPEYTQISTTDIRAVPLNNDVHQNDNPDNRPMFQRSRSISAGSIAAPPPGLPLPELPDHSINQGRRMRSVSTDVQIHYSEASITSPTSVRHQIDQFNHTSELSRFEFGLSGGENSPPKFKAYVPNLSIDTKSAFNNQPIQSQSLRSRSSGKNTPSGNFEVIDASSWNIPRGLRHLVPDSPSWERRSPSGIYSQFIADPRKTRTAPNSTTSSPSRMADETSRPPSVTSVDMFRVSVVGSPASGPAARGHKRQNCVRIKNLQPLDPKKRSSSQLGRLAEVEEGSSILLPSPAKRLTENNKKEQKEPLRGIDRSPPMSLRVKRPGLVAIRSASGQSVRSTGQSPTTTAGSQSTISVAASSNTSETFVRPLQLMKKASSSEISNLSNIDFSPASQSFFSDAGSPQRQKSKIQGPRNIPAASLRVRNQTGSPIRRKSSAGRRTALEANLRRSTTSRNSGQANTSINQEVPSVMLIESSPATSTRILASSDHWSTDAKSQRKRSNTVAGHRGEMSHTGIKSLEVTESRAKPQRLETSQAPARSHHSPSAISIWEDISVCADSPDIDHPLAQFRQPQSRSRPTSTHLVSPSKFKQASELIARFEGIENAHKEVGEDREFKDEDQRSQKVAMRAGNRKRSQTTSAQLQFDRGIGLGLRFD